MKQLRLFAIIVLAIGITSFHSCKKDEELTNNNETKALTSTFNPNEIENMDEYLMGFMKELKSATRDSEPMTIEDAEWHLSACLNFMYCNGKVERTHIHYDTVISTVNINNGTVSLTEINNLIQDISNEVVTIYNASSIEDKNLLFIKPEIIDDTRSGATVRTTIVTSGNYYFIGGLLYPESEELEYLFNDDLTYKWDEEACDSLNYYMNVYIPDASNSNNDERIYYTSITNVEFNYVSSPGRLFYCGNCSYNYELSAEDMRSYLDSYLGLIVENNQYYRYAKLCSNVKPALGMISDKENTLPVPIRHELHVQYGVPTSTNIEVN